jgi:hypothetical protein
MRTLVVVAHPDDETLWFSPILSRTELVIAALPEHGFKETITHVREAVREDFPIPLEYLPLEASGVFRQSDWGNRKLTYYGVELLETCPAEKREHYIANYDRLVSALAPYVADSAEIYSHNPWGEYGHEAHIQVWCAVSTLAREHGKTVWVWDGLSNETLVARGTRTRLDYFTPLPPDLRERELDADLETFKRLRRIYEEHGAWTYPDHYEPPNRSRYLEAVRAGSLVLAPGSNPGSGP